MRNLARVSLACAALIAGLVVTMTGTTWLVDSHYHTPSAATDQPDCTAYDSVTSATVTVTATITTAGVTYPRLENVVDIVAPLTPSGGSSVLFSGEDSPIYRTVLGCLLGRPFWQQDTDQHTEPPTITAEGKQLKIHYVSYGDLTPYSAAAPTMIGYFRFYYDEQSTWTLDLTYPHSLMGAKWSVTLNAPAGWLNSAQPAPTSVPSLARMEWGPMRPTGDAMETGGGCANPTSCLRVKLAVEAPYRLLTDGGSYPGGLITSLLTWAPWCAMLTWTFVLTSGYVAGRRGPGGRLIGTERILLPIALITVAAILIMATDSYTVSLPEWRYADYLTRTLIEGMGLTVLATVAAGCWGLSRLPTGLVGLAALVMAGMAAPNLNSADDRLASLACVLLSGYGLLLCALVAAGYLSALWLLIAGRRSRRYPEYVFWIGGTVIGLALTAERDGVHLTATTASYWLSPTYPGTTDLLGNLITFPTDLSSAASSAFGLLIVGVLFRAMFDTARWDEGVGHPRARLQLLTLGAAVFFSGVDWDVTLWTWPLSLWVIVLPLVALTFRRFRSILDTPVPSGRSLRSVILGYGLDALRVDAKRWRAAIREARSVDKRLGQGSIEIAAHRTEMSQVDLEAEQSRGLILANRVDDVLVRVTPIDLLLTVGPYPSRAANAQYAVKVAALCGLPFVIVLTACRWLLRSYQDGGSYLLSIFIDASWMTIVLIGSGAVVGMIWQHLPGRRGPVRVLPLVGLYMITPVVAFVVSDLTDTDKGETRLLSLVELLCFLAVATSVGLAMDLRALRDIRPPWQLRMQALAFAYGTENLAAQLTFLAGQLSAVIGLVTFIKTGDLSSPAPTSSGHSPQGP